MIEDDDVLLRPHGSPTTNRCSIVGTVFLAIAAAALSFAFSAVMFGFWLGVIAYLLAGGATLVFYSMISTMPESIGTKHSAG
jgi:hypothetical protein